LRGGERAIACGNQPIFGSQRTIGDRAIDPAGRDDGFAHRHIFVKRHRHGPSRLDTISAVQGRPPCAGARIAGCHKAAILGIDNHQINKPFGEVRSRSRRNRIRISFSNALLLMIFGCFAAT
jgi:hypothetical protein